MKYLLSGVAAIAMLTACGDSTPAPAGEEDLGEITLRDGDPAEADAVITAMSLTNSGDGIVQYGSKNIDGATATFSDVTIAGDEDGAITASSLEFEGLDMVEDQASFSRMTLNGIVLEDPEETGAVNVAKIEVLNPTPELAAWLAASLGQGEPAPFPSADQLGFASWSISDVAGEFSDDDGDGSFSLGNFEVRDLADQKAKRATLSGLAFNFLATEDGQEVPVEMRLANASFSGLDLDFIEAIQQNLDDEEAMMAAMMDKMYENPMDPGYDRVSMDDFMIAAAGATFTMPSFDASVERNSNDQPVKYVTQPFTMTLDADPDGGEAGAGLAQGLSMVGYESIELKGESVVDYDPENDIAEMDASDNYFEIVDGATFSFGGRIGGYAAYSQAAANAFDFEAISEGAEPDPAAFQEAVNELSVYSFEFSIEDDSLLDRVFNAYAAQSGQDPVQLRNQAAQMTQMAPMMAQGTGIDMAIVSELSQAVSAFISDAGTLTITMNPDEPLSAETLSAMEDPSMLTKDYLGFSATHEE